MSHQIYILFLKSILLVHKPGSTFAAVEVMSIQELEQATNDVCSSDQRPKLIREELEQGQLERDDQTEGNDAAADKQQEGDFFFFYVKKVLAKGNINKV